MCGSVQGQCPPVEIVIDTATDCRLVRGIGWSGQGPVEWNYASDTLFIPACTKHDADYWNCVLDSIGVNWGTLKSLMHHRRLDRWYLDTVQVCDTVKVPTEIGPNYEWWADLLGEHSFILIVKCRDTTIYAKRMKTTNVEWIIPIKLRKFDGLHTTEE